MLQSLNHLHGFTLHASDGELGKVRDLYFDDQLWTIRYCVVDTGAWLTGRRVLISPASIAAVDWSARTVRVTLTCDQVKQSPQTETDMPVSRQQEVELSAHYGWPPYWTSYPYGLEPISFPTQLPPAAPATSQGDPHLRSTHEVKGYHVGANDGLIGHISDFVFDDESWSVVYLVANTGTWLHQRLVLIDRDSIDSIDWADRDVAVRLARETVRTSPQFDGGYPLAPDYAEHLVRHYRRDG
ncbi:MAG TPA: PRC-barrel domain-containing protein [Bryobacteraceae bacterium]|jgi:uncharacterized protein YrrD|nr:PRC-barrel domain-containing protein [Bryobacteraceae bacterium]